MSFQKDCADLGAFQRALARKFEAAEPSDTG
jgi:hypothetical protein